MAVVTMRQLLESGVHFGHQTRRWNPKMKRFIMTERNGIYIIDLQQSLAYIDRTYAFIKDTVAKGGTVMFVGTKKQAQEAIAEQATRVGMPYVNQRWLGGMLTNFQTVHQRINRLKELDEIDFDDVAGSGRTKKELLQMQRERDKLDKTLGGIRDMTRTPVRGVDRRHQQGAPGRRGGPQAPDPDHRHPRHQLRPRRGRLPDPGQRRRHPRGRPADPRGRRRRRRGPDGPLRRQDRRGHRDGRRRGAAGRVGARAPGRRGRQGCGPGDRWRRRASTETPAAEATGASPRAPTRPLQAAEAAGRGRDAAEAAAEAPAEAAPRRRPRLPPRAEPGRGADRGRARLPPSSTAPRTAPVRDRTTPTAPRPPRTTDHTRTRSTAWRTSPPPTSRSSATSPARA